MTDNVSRPAISAAGATSLVPSEADIAIADAIESVAELAVPPEATDSEPKADVEGPRAWGFDVETINREFALVLLGSRAIVVKEQRDASAVDRIRFLSLDAFQAWFANKTTEILTADGKTKAVSWARAWLAHRHRRQFEGVEFYPNPDGAPGTDGYLNLWQGFGVMPSSQGSYRIFRDHLLNNVCGGNTEIFDYVFAWFSHMVQRPRERIGTAIVLRGAMGSGKTKVGEIFGSLVPAHHFQIDDQRYVVGNFNAHMAQCLLLQAEEAVWAGDKAAEGRLKGLVTSEYQMIESKGIDPIRMRNHVRLFMTSNEDWAVPAGKDERRFLVLDVDPRCAQNHGYFAEMEAELNNGGRERLLYDLLRLDLDKVNLRQIPRTAALLEQKIRSFDQIEQWWYNRLFDGNILRNVEGWPAQVAKQAVFADYLHAANEAGISRKRSAADLGMKLAKLVPGLRDCRPRISADDGAATRQWCYVVPPLDECRTAFEALLGQALPWPAASLAGESEREKAPDDVVPL